MKKIIYKSLALIFATVALSSCLKDDSTVLDPKKAGANVIDFLNPTDIAVAGSTTPLYVYSFPITPTPTPIELTISYSGAEDAAPKDITVNIGTASQGVIDQYNTEQSKAFVMMPASWYTLSATSVVIPKGQKTASFKVNVNTSLIDLTKAFVLPLKLTSTDATVSSNFGTALFLVGAKNKYDGFYASSSGTIQRYSSPGNPTTDALNGNIGGNRDITLTTIDANTVQISGHQWANNGGGIGGIDGLQILIDPSTNLVTMRANGNATLGNIAGSVNKYDPATKEFTLNFIWNPTANVREVKNWVFKFKGPRP